MKLPDVRNRHTVNISIASAVVFHLISLMAASRFDSLFVTRAALYYGLALYFVLGPIFWLWHRATRPINKRATLDSIVETMAQAQTLSPYDPTAFFDNEKGLFAGLDIDDALKPV